MEDALCLLRVLVETSINLWYAIKIGPKRAAIRYFDWSLLDAVRRRRDQGAWLGGIAKTPEDVKKLLEQEAKLKKKYTPAEIEAFKRKGVFGESLEQRAKIADEERLYKGSYRITSRNSHAIDIIELRAMKDMLGEAEFAHFFNIRLDHVLSVSRYCLASHALWINAQFRCGLDERLKALQVRDKFPVQF